MLYNPKDYRTNRKAVLELRKKVPMETKTLAQLEAIGITRKEIRKWENEGKLKALFWKNKNHYPFKRVKQLFLKENLLPGMQSELF